MSEKITCAGYGRVSTLAQVEEGTSAKDQKDRIKRLCKEKNWRLYEFYSDDGYSGINMANRPGIQNLIADAKAGKFNTLCFTRLDRIGRNLRELLNFWNLMQEKLNLDIVCIDDSSVNTEGRSGKMILHMLGMFAEFERDVIRDRMEGGRKIKWKNQEAFIGGIPFGYNWNKDTKKIEKVPEQVRIYEKIVSLYIDENHSFIGICNKLTSEGTPTPSVMAKKYKEGKRNRAKQWNTKTIGAILKNPAYKGRAMHNRYKYELSKYHKHYMQRSKIEKAKDEWVSVEFPRLISEERWDQIQARIEYQKQKTRKRHRGFEEHFMCENVLYCGECGAKMKKQPQDEKNKRKDSYYVCYWKSLSKKQLEIHNRKRCNSKHWNADHIDQWIYDEIVNCMVAPSKYAKSWLKDIDIEKIQFKLDRLRNMEKEQRSKIEAAYDLITNERNAEIKAKYLEKKKKDDKIYDRILADIRMAKSELNLARNKTERLAQFESAFKKASLRKKFGLAFRREGHLKKYLYELPFNEKKRILEGVISPETDGKCRIRYVTPDDIMDDRINTKMSKEERIQPLKSRDPIIEMDFGLDMDRIETLITGLNKTKLYREFDKDRITVE